MSDQVPSAEAEAPAAALVHVRMPLALATRDTGDLLATLKSRAPDPAIFDEFPPVFFDVRASDNSLDSFHTRMMPSTLQNYARDAGAGQGVPFLNSHRQTDLAAQLGRTVAGRFVRGAAAREHRTEVTVFSQPTMLAAQRDYYNLARAGQSTDVSVGFHGGHMVCSICGGEMLRWYRDGGGDGDQAPCYHVPGVEYAMTDSSGTKTGARQTAVGLIEDARLGELSACNIGSNDNAQLIGFKKARQLADAGLLLPEVRSAVEARYDLTLPGPARHWAPGTPTRTEEDQMGETETTNQRASATELTQARDAEAARWRETLTATLRSAAIEVPEGAELVGLVRSLAGEVVALRPLADDGKAWRAALVRDAVAEGVRAFGDGFATERQTARLERMAPEDIQFERESWAAIAARALPGGQATTGDNAAGDAATKAPDAARPAIPADAYRTTGRRR